MEGNLVEWGKFVNFADEPAMRGASEEGLHRALGGSITYERRLTALYFLANRNVGNFDFAVKDEAIVDALGCVYVSIAYSIHVDWEGFFHISIHRGVILPLLIPLQWYFLRPRLAE